LGFALPCFAANEKNFPSSGWKKFLGKNTIIGVIMVGEAFDA
jgi:hypothetical protein